MSYITERLLARAGDVFLRPATVTRVEQLADTFVDVELTADAFRGVTWTPGAKLQFRTRRESLATRTYTPTDWDPDAGVTHLLAFTHGDGPAARWFHAARPGQICEVFGPRKSLDLDDLAPSSVPVGDETSAGLACAAHTRGTPDARFVFEATDPPTLRSVLAARGLDVPITVVDKSDDRAALRRALLDAIPAATEFDLVLTGDAATIANLRRAVRDWPHRPAHTRVKTYWAKGRAGLD